MRKQVQKERCTKIMLTKCKAVCCLYDKVQLAAAKMLDATTAIIADITENATLDMVYLLLVRNYIKAPDNLQRIIGLSPVDFSFNYSMPSSCCIFYANHFSLTFQVAVLSITRPQSPQ